jgi:hypothetical protein
VKLEVYVVIPQMSIQLLTFLTICDNDFTMSSLDATIQVNNLHFNTDVGLIRITNIWQNKFSLWG